MRIIDTIKSQSSIIRKNKIYYLFILLLYIFAAFFDVTNKWGLTSFNDYIYRYNFQQLIIVIFNIIFVMRFINEKYVNMYRNFLNIYIQDSYQYFWCFLMTLSLANIIPFIIGQLAAYVVYNGPIQILVVNIIIVSIEIVVSVLLSMSFVLLIKKDILVYASYYILVVISLVLNNIYIAFPLTINLLETEEYYITFASGLWIGRILLLIFSLIFFIFVLKRFVKGINK